MIQYQNQQVVWAENQKVKDRLMPKESLEREGHSLFDFSLPCALLTTQVHGIWPQER